MIAVFFVSFAATSVRKLRVTKCRLIRIYIMKRIPSSGAVSRTRAHFTYQKFSERDRTRANGNAKTKLRPVSECNQEWYRVQFTLRSACVCI
jgi:hypothetical protein